MDFHTHEKNVYQLLLLLLLLLLLVVVVGLFVIVVVVVACLFVCFDLFSFLLLFVLLL